MVFEIRVDFGVVSAIFLGLVLFGISYNRVIGWAEHRGYIEGYTSLMVAVGVVFTLIPLAILSWQFVLLVAGAFIASGTPMILGSITRYITQRAAAIRAIREDMNADSTPGVAQ